MIKKSFLFAFCMLIPFILAGCDELAKNKGESFTRKITVVSKYNMSFFSNVDDKSAELFLSCNVIDVDNKGNALVRATIDKIESKIATMGVMFQFSTDNPELNTKENSRPEMQKKYVEIFSELIGKSYSAVVAKNGNVLELKDIDPAIEKYVKAQTDNNITGHNQAIMLLTDSMLREYVSPGVYNGSPTENSHGVKSTESVIVVPGLPVVAVIRAIVEPGNMAESTSSWPSDTIKHYYGISADGLPQQLSKADETPARPDDKYRSQTHTAIAVFGNGCVGYSPTGKFVKMVERNVIEVSSNRLTDRPNDGTRRRVQMYYIIDKTIENL